MLLGISRVPRIRAMMAIVVMHTIAIERTDFIEKPPLLVSEVIYILIIHLRMF
jgi:hypothetical protein